MEVAYLVFFMLLCAYMEHSHQSTLQIWFFFLSFFVKSKSVLSILTDLKDWLHLDCEPKNILSLGLHYVAELHCCACLLNYLAGIYKWPYASHFGLRGKSTHWIYYHTNKEVKTLSKLSLNHLPIHNWWEGFLGKDISAHVLKSYQSLFVLPHKEQRPSRTH